MTPPLPRLFYLRPTLAVAHDLLGCLFVKRTGKKLLVGKIVEVEAYKQNDPASHSFHGQTQRNDVMFLEGGHLYVYFTYGMHFCANVVTGKEGIGEAVLIRAVEPLSGLETMEKNRFSVAQSHNHTIAQWLNHPITQSLDLSISRSPNTSITQSPNRSISQSYNLTNGPAKFCKAFGIERPDNGTDLLGGDIFITRGEAVPSSAVVRSQRIGIREGTEKNWRFFLKGNLWVSRK